MNTLDVAVEAPAAEPMPDPEPAVVFAMPAEKKETQTTPTANRELEVACTVLANNDDKAQPASEIEPAPIHVSQQPVPASAPLAAVTDKAQGERSFQLRDFTGIKVASDMDVTLEIGDFAVTATGEEDALEQLNVQVKNGVLELGFANSERARRKHGPVHFSVRTPVVRALHVTGSGSINGNELPSTSNLDLNVMGSGSIILARLIDAKALTMLVKGSGGIQVEEVLKTESAQLNVMGSGVAEVRQIAQAGSLQVVVAGSGVANCKQVNVSGTTTLSMTGSGTVHASGKTEHIIVSVLGSGDVLAKDLKSQGGKVTVTGSGNASVHSDAPLEMLTTGSGTIHTSGNAGTNRSRGVGNDE